MHTPRRSAVLALALGLLVVAPAAAGAQLGGFLKKKVGDAVADRVVGDQTDARQPKFSSTVLEINDGRLDQLLRGVQAEVAARDAVMAPFRAYETAMTDRVRAQEEMTRCQQDAQAEYIAMTTRLASGVTPGAGMASVSPSMTAFYERLAALPERDRDALMERAEKLAEETSAAEDRGDMQAAIRLAAAARADMEKTVGMPMPAPAGGAGGGAGMSEAEASRIAAVTAKMEADLARCPQQLPPAPERPEGYGSSMNEVRDSIRVAAVTASGLDAGQYSVMRERVSAWLAMRAGKEGPYVYSAGELAALESREDELKSREQALLGENQGAGWRF